MKYKDNSRASEVLSASDYFPFGKQMAGRNYSDENYRYGFNGKENDKDFGHRHLIQDYGFRLYNPEIGKFLSVDPLFKSYPWYTPYQFAGNTPIQAIDLDGAEPYKPKPANAYQVTLANSNEITVAYLALETFASGLNFVMRDGHYSFPDGKGGKVYPRYGIYAVKETDCIDCNTDYFIAYEWTAESLEERIGLSMLDGAGVIAAFTGGGSAKGFNAPITLGKSFSSVAAITKVVPQSAGNYVLDVANTWKRIGSDFIPKKINANEALDVAADFLGIKPQKLDAFKKLKTGETLEGVTLTVKGFYIKERKRVRIKKDKIDLETLRDPDVDWNYIDKLHDMKPQDKAKHVTNAHIEFE
ncbi:RHS repeat-associated core domain-containing protein [Rapidithrix thailandica]|uniref:RHS repeat-associated core domain-containing protein n=1 Tax=Rapidithrix thailandica TaxID=413964 RepID=A0AAW9SIB0_9BACT